MREVLEYEMVALGAAKDGREVCLWRIEEPAWKVGRIYAVGDGTYMTVMTIRLVLARDINLKDVKKVGLKYPELMDRLRKDGWTEQIAVWEVRVRPGDLSDKPRLLQHSARKSGDYTTQPVRAMRGSADPGEAPSAFDVEMGVGRGELARMAYEREFRARVAEEAAELFPTANSLRNFLRVLDNLGADAPGTKKRRTG